MRKLLLLGAGGHFRSVLDCIDFDQYDDVAIVDPSLSAGEVVDGVPVVGNDFDIPRLFACGYNCAVITVGSVGKPRIRIKVFEVCRELGISFPSIIDKTAIVSKNATVAEGVFIGKGAIVNTGARLGTCCIVNTGAIIEHDCCVEDFAHIAPGVRVSGGVVVGNNSHIGIGSSVIQAVRIGSDAIIGAGSVVTKDIPDRVVAVGVPCRPIGSNEV